MNGEAAIIGTIPAAKNCQAHNAIVETLRHGERRFADIEQKVDAVPDLVVSKLCDHPEGASVGLKFGKGSLNLKNIRPVDMVKIVLALAVAILLGMKIYYDYQRELVADERRAEDRRALRQELQGQTAKTIAAIVKEELEKKP